MVYAILDEVEIDGSALQPNARKDIAKIRLALHPWKQLHFWDVEIIRGKVCQQPVAGGGFSPQPLPGFLPPYSWTWSDKWNILVQRKTPIR